MRTQKGFSLIELMVAVVIIGILIATTTIGISKSQQHTRNTQRIGDITLISKAIDQVSVQNGVYPDVTKYISSTTGATNCTTLPLTPCTFETVFGRDIDNNESPISKIDLSVFPSGKIPKDPKTGIVYKSSGQPADYFSRRITFEHIYNILNGYIYSKNTMGKLGPDIAKKNPADQTQSYYTLEVGLEDGNTSDYQIRSSEDVINESLSSNLPTRLRLEHEEVPNAALVKDYGKITGPRYRYILVGPLCGENCPL